MKKKSDNKIVGYINARVLELQKLSKYGGKSGNCYNFIYNIGRFDNFIQYREFLNTLSSYGNSLFVSGQHQVFVNDSGQLQVDTNFYCIVGKDRRSLYLLYDRKLIKVGIITEWSKYPFIKEGDDALSKYKSITDLISEKEKEICDLKAQRSRIVSYKKLSMKG